MNTEIIKQIINGSTGIISTQTTPHKQIAAYYTSPAGGREKNEPMTK